MHRNLVIVPMRTEDLDEVHRIETDVYPFPWTIRNFQDSINSGYDTWVARDTHGIVVGYFFMMLAVDEAHLLNITIRRDLQGCGLGRVLLDRVVAIAREKDALSVLLEVRPSNPRALAIYERYGFTKIGQRKGYYPAPDRTREDAIVMRYVI
jgi:ribosomal-protein-alanine N-acetyltransferase